MIDLAQLFGVTVDDSCVAVVVAHQDDEAIGFSGVVHRFPRALVVHVTDGAPADAREWKHCSSREEYAAVRAREAAASLDAANHAGVRIALGICDSQVLWHLRQLLKRLADLFSQHEIRFVFTHAFEGGHPDHDATAFAVKTAAVCSGATVVEAPFYRQGEAGSVWQCFEPRTDCLEHEVLLAPQQQRIKARMLAAHASQAVACAKASKTIERFRVAPPHDYLRLPTRISRNYARSGIDAALWKSLLESAR